MGLSRWLSVGSCDEIAYEYWQPTCNYGCVWLGILNNNEEG